MTTGVGVAGHYAAQVVAVAGGCWFVLWLLVGGTATGKSWYDSLAKDVFGDSNYKAGLPMITIIWPLMISTALALFLGRCSSTTSTYIFGHVHFGRLALWGVTVPLLVYTACSVYRHVMEEDTLDDQWMESGNAFGYASLIAINVLMIPVTRHSALLKLMGWNPAAAIRLHIWSGRFIVIFSWIHGLIHLYRFAFVLNYDSVVKTLIPPPYCWTMQGEDLIPDCNQETADCSCYHRWRNLIGVVTGLLLVLVALSSLHTVRRQVYPLFYRIHVLAGPTVLIGVILHWDRSILYVCGGILYYLATSLLVILESRINRPVTLVQVEHLPSIRPCVAMTFLASEPAILQYPEGAYVRLREERNRCSCSYNTLSHPFTINLVPRQPGHVRIIYRVTGDFTTQLAAEISPRLYLDGYHGQVRSLAPHDVAILIAGGIGITPYLSLLHKSADSSSLSANTRVRLHWICRDATLIAYIKREYLDTLPPDHEVSIVIHATGEDDESTYQQQPSSYTKPVEEEGDPLTLPFAPLRFAPLKPVLSQSAKFLLLPFVLMVGPCLACIWYMYTHVQDSHEVLPRTWNILIVLGWGAVVAVASNMLLNHGDPTVVQWTPLNASEDDYSDCNNNNNNNSLVEMVAPGTRGRVTSSDESPSSGAAVANGGGVIATNGSGSPTNGSTSPRSSSSMIQILRGRPSSMAALLLGGHNECESSSSLLFTAERPAVYCCGPTSLVTEVRSAVQQSRRCCTLRGRIALYEESFEL